MHEELSKQQHHNCKLALHMLHSVVPHDQQRRALEPPPAGHCKIVISTNIAESSVTIPDVRYILDFGIVRKMVFDEDLKGGKSVRKRSRRFGFVALNK